MTFSKIDGNALVECLSGASKLAMLLYDDKGTILEWNDCLQEKTGLERSQCIGRNIEDVFYSTKQPSLHHTKECALHGEAIIQKAVANIVNSHAGQPGFILHHIPLPDRNQRINWVAVLLLEQQEERKQPETKISNALKVISDFMHYAPIPVYMVDADLRIKLANSAFYEFCKPEGGEVTSLSEAFSAEVSGRLQEHVAQVMQQDRVLMFTEEYVPNGKVYHIYNIIFPVKNRLGVIDAVGGYFIDITERVVQARQNKKLLEETLRLNQELEKKNTELETKRKELARANRKLKQQKKELQRVVDELSDRNYELDQIMYKTSHDLRAPLTSVLGLLQLAKQETDIKKLPEYHGYIENRINKLDNFVKAMLTFAKTSRSEVDPQPIDWEKMIADSCEQVKYLANYPKIDIHIDCQSKNYEFVNDPVRLNIVLNNLLGNAVKYADIHKDHPAIDIRVENQEDKVLLSIADNGIGIMEEHLGRICEMFYRATDRSEGSGLGMYIVKQTVDKLNGKLTIASEVNKGTTVTLEIPQIRNKTDVAASRPPVSQNAPAETDAESWTKKQQNEIFRKN